jgi:MptA/FolE2 family GTP cyclohydrolase
LSAVPCLPAIGFAMFNPTDNWNKNNLQASFGAGSVALSCDDISKSIQDKSFVDIPASKPAVQCALQRVGVSNRPCYIQIRDPFNGNPTKLYGDIKVVFGLPAKQRGVHMSRIEECLSEMLADSDLPLSLWIDRLSERLLKRQGLTSCAVHVDICYEKTTTKNPSQILGHEMITLHSAIEKDEDQMRVCTGVTVPFINACPCTQRWGMREFYTDLVAHGYDPAEAQELVQKAPLQAHTNLGRASLKIWSDQATHEKIYNLLDRAVPIVRELLKGVDEHALVRHAHKQGQFCEDNARQIVQEVVAESEVVIEDNAIVEIVVEVNESVHFHNLYTELKSTFGDLKKALC